MPTIGNPPIFIDTHAHLDDPAFDRDRAAVIAAAHAAGVTRVINIGYRPRRWESTRLLAANNPGIRMALGLHPHHAEEFTVTLGDELTAAIRYGGAVALGEIGLDFYRNFANQTMQRQAFVAQLNLARELKLPAIIHQRGAEAAFIELVADRFDLPQLVLHSFDGSAHLAGIVLERSWIVGVGGLATRAAAAPLRKVLATIPMENIVLETDSPYLVPAGVTDRRNTPINVPLIAARISSVWGVTPADLAAQTTITAQRVFGLGLASGLEESRR